MSVYTGPDCAELFHVVYLSGTFPGGKERENIDCPARGKSVGSEVTSAVLSTKALTTAEKVAYQTGQGWAETAHNGVFVQSPFQKAHSADCVKS